MFTRKSLSHFRSMPITFLTVLALLVGSLALPTNALAVGLAIWVNTTADSTATDGKCSLREALANANSNNGNFHDCTQGFADDGIFFSDTLGTATIFLGSALPPVTDRLGLIIDGSGDITISGNNLYRPFAVFGNGSLTLNNLTVKNGKSSTISDAGGGVLVSGNGTSILNINGSSFLENSAGGGGAILNHWGTVTITNSTFSGNTANNGGGVLFNGGGVVTLLNSSFSNNSGGPSGGAVSNYVDPAFPSGGKITITGSSFSRNAASLGAGIYNNDRGRLEITSSSFTKNIGDGIHNQNGEVIILGQGEFSGNQGNGIYTHSDTGDFNSALLRVWDSSFTLNTGSGVYNDLAGTNIFRSTFDNNGNSGVRNLNGSVVTVTKSTFQRNTANYGAGIYNANSNLHLFNSTLSENEAANKGGGLYNSAVAELVNNTFSGNAAKYGGGVFNESPGDLRLYNTILANSTLGGDCQNSLGALTGGNNLIEAVGMNACNLINGVDRNIVGADPNLGTLAGSPAYFPLNPGSLSIDTGDDAECLIVSNESQNNVSRPQGIHCDIGSYEVSMSIIQGQTQKLGQDIQDLVDAGLLSADNGQILTSMLDACLEAVDKGDPKAGIEALGGFIDQANSLVKSGELESANAQVLIDDAQAIIAELE